MALVRVLGALAAALIAATSLAQADPLTPAQQDAVEKIIHDYIVNHPDLLLDAIQGAQAKRDADASRQAIAAKRDLLLHDPTSSVGGNPDGDVTIVEFFDYRCPYCKEVEPSLEALLKEDGKLRIVYKEFPVLGPASVYASRLALAARAQGKYDAFHHDMMATKGTIDDGVVDRVAKSVGIDMEKIKTALADPAIDRIIRSNLTLAEALDIQGTPAFIIGDTLVPGVAEITTLKKLVAAARNGG